jgi:hypothetical protein
LGDNKAGNINCQPLSEVYCLSGDESINRAMSYQPLREKGISSSARRTAYYICVRTSLSILYDAGSH